VPPEVYPVHQVTRYLRELLESNHHLSEIWVAGEVSNFSRASSGHMYFTLKDERGALRCVFFRNRNVGLRTALADGQSVVVYGSLSLYEQRGDLSFVVDFVQPEGTGALAAEFERRREAFEAEGLFAPERKRPLPAFPERVGVVTSATGAVFHDISDVLARRWPLATLVLQPAPVQGDGAAPAVADAIRTIARAQALDVLVVARGGGSAEDLWAFNEEPVVRAIFACPVPVVSAVGHETDVTLADLVADVRAPTPSAAAELIAPDRAVVGGQVAALASHVQLSLMRSVTLKRESIETRRAALGRALPSIENLSGRVADYAGAMTREASNRHAQAAERVAALAARVGTLSPFGTLERGYALVTYGEDGTVASAAALQPGDHVRLRFFDGSRFAAIEDRP
jgi:exodeoxyribonuclease VII large subunit